jgi:uroporphyrinogen decarboxylase
MLTRRHFLLASAAAPAILRGSSLTSKERVDRALKGEDVDRIPFTFWHHFLDDSKPAEDHARSTLAFHERFHTDLVKVMSDYPYPKPAGEWTSLKVEDNPFPRQVRALELVKEGLGGNTHFVETIFNPWYVAEKLSSREQVMTLKSEQPQQLLDALEVIAKSEANHARRSIRAGAAGVFLAIQNAQAGYLTEEDYVKFSEPFDKIVLEAVPSAPLNTLHLHTDAHFGDHLYIERFYRGWPAAVINYSMFTKIAPEQLRARYSGVIMTGLDERNYRQLANLDLKKQWLSARKGAGSKFILAPGCSVPNDSTDEELLRLPKLLAA